MMPSANLFATTFVCDDVWKWACLFREGVVVLLDRWFDFMNTLRLFSGLWWNELAMFVVFHSGAGNVFLHFCYHPGDYWCCDAVSISRVCIVGYACDAPIYLQYFVFLLSRMINPKRHEWQIWFGDTDVTFLKGSPGIWVRFLKCILWRYVEWHHSHVLYSVLWKQITANFLWGLQVAQPISVSWCKQEHLSSQDHLHILNSKSCICVTFESFHECFDVGPNVHGA